MDEALAALSVANQVLPPGLEVVSLTEDAEYLLIEGVLDANDVLASSKPLGKVAV